MKPIITSLLASLAIPVAQALTLDPTRTESYHTAWTRVHDETIKFSQFARAVAMDSRGNVFVAGHMDVNASKQLYVAKYDALDGRRVWHRTIPASGVNQVLANAIAVDDRGDCVVVGSQNIGGAIDYYTHKFDGTDGDDEWVGGARTYNGTASGQDIALKVVIDSGRNIIVTGRSAGAGSGDDIVTFKYEGDTGNVLGPIDRYSAVAGTFNDFPGALATDGVNIYVGGVAAINNSTQRFVVRKLDPFLVHQWTITPIDLGGEGGVTGIAVDSQENVVATGLARNASGQFGYFTTKRDGSDGSELWKTNVPSPFSQGTFGDPRPGPVGVVIGPDDRPIVSGTLLDANGSRYIQTVKYESDGFFGSSVSAWPEPSTDHGFGFGDTVATALSVDRDGNAVVVGASDNKDGNADIYLAKYDSLTGSRTYFQGFAGPAGVDDNAVATAVDAFGNIAVLGSAGDSKGGSPGVSYREFATIKLNRFIALTGDRFRLSPDLPDYATYVSGNAPAVANDGSIAAKVTVAVGKKKLGAILTQGAGGVSNFAALQGNPAPGLTGGSTVGNWTQFSDPVIAPEGTYAFAAKVTGPSSKANGLWTNASGELRMVLQQGTPVPGLNPAANLSSILSYSMTNSDLLVRLKTSGRAPANSVLLRLSDNNTPTVLLRGGQSGVMLAGLDHTVKSFTVLSPAPSSPGDGRWEGGGSVVARVVASETANPKVTRHALLRVIMSTGDIAVLSCSGTAANEIVAGATYKSYGLPSISEGGVFYGYSATANPLPGEVTSANDTALIFTPTGVAFSAFAREGEPVPDLPSSVKYAGFSDPIIALNTIPNALFQATFKSGGGVTGANNRALMFGPPMAPSSISPVARTGDAAVQPISDDLQLTEPSTKYSSFIAYALPHGGTGSPVFLAKLSGASNASNNVGLFARSSVGPVRRLLRTGDELDGRKVKSITVLKAVSKTFGAARSFNSTGSVVVALTFTDGKRALMHVPIP
jgi:hypothetical protein